MLNLNDFNVRIFYKISSFLLLCVFIFNISSNAQVFSLTSVPDDFTAVYTDISNSSRTITVTLEPRNTACASFDNAGRATVFATQNTAACDRTIAINFQTSGFALESIRFNDIDDIDGAAPRDTFAANVAGTWTSPTIEIFSFANPPAFADQASRLTSAGAVGTFLANALGNNPTDETAEFTLAVPQSSITILFDDVQGVRNAQGFFSLDPIGATINENADIVTEKILASADRQPAEGDIVTFQINITNNGPADATNVSLRDLLPEGLSATPANGTVTTGSYDSVSGIWLIPTLPSGVVATLTIEGTVDPGRGGQIIENTVLPAEGDQPDPSTAGDDLTEEVTIDNDIIATPDSVANVDGANGQTNVINVFTGDSIAGAPAGPANATLSIAPGSSLPPQLAFDPATGNVDVLPNTPAGTYSFEYQICETSNPTNCRIASVTVVVAPTVDLMITKTNTPGVNGNIDQANDELTAFETTTYVITVTNNGPDTATGAIVSDVIGAGLTCDANNIVSISGDGAPGGTFTVADLTGAGITLGTLSNGQAATLSYDCIVTP